MKPITFEELAYLQTIEEAINLYQLKTNESFQVDELIVSLKEDWRELRDQKIEDLLNSKFIQKEIPKIQAKKERITYNIYLIDHGLIANDNKYVEKVKNKISSLNDVFLEQNFDEMFETKNKYTVIPDHSVLSYKDLIFSYIRIIIKAFSKTNILLELGLIDKIELRNEADKITYSDLLPFTYSELPPMVAVDLYVKGLNFKGFEIKNNIQRSKFQTEYIIKHKKSEDVNVFVGFEHGYQIKYFIEKKSHQM